MSWYQFLSWHLGHSFLGVHKWLQDILIWMFQHYFKIQYSSKELFFCPEPAPTSMFSISIAGDVMFFNHQDSNVDCILNWFYSHFAPSVINCQVIFSAVSTVPYRFIFFYFIPFPPLLLRLFSAFPKISEKLSAKHLSVFLHLLSISHTGELLIILDP